MCLCVCLCVCGAAGLKQLFLTCAKQQARLERARRGSFNQLLLDQGVERLDSVKRYVNE